jgi:hypothetical protein
MKPENNAPRQESLKNRGNQDPPTQAAKRNKANIQIQRRNQIQFFLSARRNENRKQSTTLREPKIVESKIHPRKPQKEIKPITRVKEERPNSLS